MKNSTFSSEIYNKKAKKCIIDSFTVNIFSVNRSFENEVIGFFSYPKCSTKLKFLFNRKSSLEVFSKYLEKFLIPYFC